MCRRGNMKTAFSLQKRLKCFLSTLRRGNVKTQPPPAAEELECTLEPHDYQDDPIFENLRFPIDFRQHKRKASVFKSHVRRAFSKSCVSVWISEGGRLNRRNNAVFSNFSGLVFPGPEV